MIRLLDAIGGICLLMSLATCTMARSAPHEIEGLIWMLSGIVAISGSLVAQVVKDSVKKLSTPKE